MDAFQFIKDVPADWEETIGVAAEIGDFAAIARKERGGENWYLGAITDENARKLDLPLEFLDEGKTYVAEIYRDGPKADYDRNPYDIVIEKRDVKSTDLLRLSLGRSGGAAVRFVPKE
jgi:alpha-glucosidase